MAVAKLRARKSAGEDEKTPIYMCVSMAEGQLWYAIHSDFTQPTSNRLVQNPLSPICTLYFNNPNRLEISNTVIGSNIYVFGGLREFKSVLGTNEARVYSMEDDQWTQLEPMISDRVVSTAVPYRKDVIYVFGCASTPVHTLKHWGEVYHLHSGTWSPLPPLPTCVYDPSNLSLKIFVRSFVALPNLHKILLYLSNFELLGFNTESKDWVSIHIPLDPPSFQNEYVMIADSILNTRLVAANRLLYVFFGLHLFVYNLDSHDSEQHLQPVYGCLPDLPFASAPNSPVIPVHMGNGNFCLTWYPQTNWKDSITEKMIHCVRFRVDTDLDFVGKSFQYATYLGCDVFTTSDGRPIRHYSAARGA